MLDLYKLKIFTLVAQMGSFTKTADVLLLSQSAVSQHIKGLEQELGVRLFTRGRSGATLTHEGKTLLRYAEEILMLSATAVNAVTNVANLKEGQLRLGIATLIGNYILPPFIHRFRQQYPNLRVFMETVNKESVRTALDTGQFDLVFIMGWGLPNKRVLSTQQFREVDVVLAVGKQHEWRDRKQLNLQEMDGRSLTTRPSYSYARQWLDTLFAQHHIQPDVVLVSDELETIKRAVIEGQCAAFLPLCAISKELSYGDLFALSVPEIVSKPMVTLAWSRKRPFTPISRAFITNLARDCPLLQPLLAE